MALGLALISLASCKKSYTCSCEIDYYDSQGNYSYTGTQTMQSTYSSKKKAQSDCDDFKSSFIGADITCELL